MRRRSGGTSSAGQQARANPPLAPAPEYDEATWATRTFMPFVCQRISVAIQLAMAQQIAEAMRMSVAADPRAAP